MDEMNLERKAKRQSREGVCEYPECGSTILAKRLCVAHYTQLKRNGVLKDVSVRALPDEERFWHYVDRRGLDECWEWKGGTTSYLHTKNQYGVFNHNYKSVNAHTYSYKIHNEGVELEGFHIDHQCRNTMCVNPSHLKKVTPSENAENRVAHKNNKVGVRGVSIRPNGNYTVTVGRAGKRINGGTYRTLEEAEVAARELRMELHTNNVTDWESK